MSCLWFVACFILLVTSSRISARDFWGNIDQDCWLESDPSPHNAERLFWHQVALEASQGTKSYMEMASDLFTIMHCSRIDPPAAILFKASKQGF